MFLIVKKLHLDFVYKNLLNKGTCEMIAMHDWCEIYFKVFLVINFRDKYFTVKNVFAAVLQIVMFK